MVWAISRPLYSVSGGGSSSSFADVCVENAEQTMAARIRSKYDRNRIARLSGSPRSLSMLQRQHSSSDGDGGRCRQCAVVGNDAREELLTRSGLRAPLLY